MEWTLFIGFCFALLVIFILKSIRIYRIYNNKVYKYIYSGFIEYYIKYRYKKDLSISDWLNQEIGYHRILFNNYLNDKKESVYEIITIFHQHGVTIFSVLNNVGVISGNQKDKHWIISHDDKKYRIKNPFLILNQHKEYVGKQIENSKIINTFVLISPNSTCTTSCVVHFDEILECLKKDETHCTKEEVLDLYIKMTKRG